MKVKQLIPLLLVFLIAAFVVCFKLYWERSLPPRNGYIDLPNLKQQVVVIKDEFGIPHIKALNEEDMYMALGYLMASERLFQMDVHRRLASGRLSEVFGNKALNMDKLSRTFMFRRVMENLLANSRERMNPDMLKGLQAFYQGVNYYIDTKPLPLEFTLLGYKPEHFEMVDAFSFVGYMGYNFATSFEYDLLLTDVGRKLSNKLMEELKIFPDSNDSVTTLFPKGAADIIGWQRIVDTVDGALNTFGGFDGSNSWVLAGKRSESGYPILANDPHMKVAHPGFWYEAHIETPTYSMYGHFLPLIAFPVLGHNRDYGWALTMSKVDEINLYEEKVDYEKELVMYKGQWVPMGQHQEVIKIRGGEEVVLPIRTTPHGPLIGKKFLGFELESDLSLRWIYHDEDNFFMDGLYGMGHAKDMKDFYHYISMGTAPGLNISYADSSGNIGWKVFGKIPIMPENVRSDRLLDGSSGKEEIQGYLPYEKNPESFNPESGVIVSANYLPAGFDKKWQGLWEPNDRFDTISKLLSIKEKWSLEEMMGLQTGNVDLEYGQILERILSVLGSAVAELTPLELEAFQRLTEWNMNSDIDSVGASLFHLWNRNIVNLVLDELDPKQRDYYCQLTTYWFFYKRLLDNFEASWWDRVETKQIESAEDIILLGWKNTVAFLAKSYGTNPDEWQWGLMHRIEYRSPLGMQKPFNLIFNIGPFPAPGGFNQINNIRATGCGNTLDVSVQPSARRLVDFQDASISYGILPIGQSEHVLSKHYADQVSMFLEGKYRLQLLDWDEIFSRREGIIIFSPLLRAK